MDIQLKRYRIEDSDSEDWIILGPWVGEFGWELIYWQGFVRFLREQLKDTKLVAIGREETLYLYSDSVDEYWSLPQELLGGGNMYLPGSPLDRFSCNRIIRQIFNQFEPSKMISPSMVHEKGTLSFGKPLQNQEFVPLVPQGMCELLAPTEDNLICLFPRLREQDPEKNLAQDKWGELSHHLNRKGYSTIICGDPNVVEHFRDLGSTKQLENIPRCRWLEVQLRYISRASLLISGESGSAFLPGLCRKPGVIFGSPRERERCCRTENIFNSNVKYLGDRDPTVQQILDLVEGFNLSLPLGK